MNSTFGTLDWIIFGSYFLILLVTTIWLSRVKVATTREYYIGANSMPMLSVAISVLATSQSAATFLGAPEYSYVKDLTFLGFYFSAFLAVLFVAYLLIPRFYAIGAVTVYELLGERYGERAKKEAGVMFLVGRLFASGARLYIGALAISMILFMDIDILHLGISIFILIVASMGYSYFGGIKAIIISDIVQAATYVGAAITLMISLFYAINTDIATMLEILNREEKLQMVNFSFNDFGDNFNFFTLIAGWLLLNIAAYGLDQDMTQRVLSCKNRHEGAKSLLYAILFTAPIAFIFLVIGLLLYLYYQHPELSGYTGVVTQKFEGDSVKILMYYILNEMPDGLRGLVTVGVTAVSISSTNSVLGAMSSVAIEDLYRPWRVAREKSSQNRADEAHYLRAGKISVLLFALLLSLMAILSYYWQHATNSNLLNFALGVMSFSYAGLLGIYFAVLFTNRGSQRSVSWALVGGFMTVLLLQNYILTFVGIDANIGFSWQLVLGTMVSFGIMMLGDGKRVG